MSTPALVVVAHGSRSDAANAAHRDLVAVVRDAYDGDVLEGFLELAEPSIPASIDRAIADGATRVLVLPYLLHPGRHVTEHIPAIVEEARTRHPGRTIELLSPFGDDIVTLGGLVATQARQALPSIAD